MSLQIHPSFPSLFIDPRQVEVWLPPSYATQPDRHYPVLYMHDGQNVFNPETSTHKIPWGVDKVLTQLIAENQAREAIVVAAWCHPEKRRNEYMPTKAFNTPRGAAIKARAFQVAGPTLSDEYLKFLVTELKPFIDTTYRALPGQPDTFVMGSSMGGLISLYAVCEYPEVFGGAGCVSTHWVAAEGICVDYMRAALPRAGQHKLYFDYGTMGTDAPYEPFQQEADAILREAGYQRGADWLTEKFPGADHNEAAWHARVHVPLAFLLRNA
ncbi:MAG: alpha/beta hydrolase [Anaerolineales bacterium]|nr:alpha/beta hydrolase [Anaerolineales bacterium]